MQRQEAAVPWLEKSGSHQGDDSATVAGGAMLPWRCRTIPQLLRRLVIVAALSGLSGFFVEGGFDGHACVSPCGGSRSVLRVPAMVVASFCSQDLIHTPSCYL